MRRCSKNITRFSLMTFLFISFGCRAQYLMHNQQEAYKIQENEKRFINKPLDSLLGAIKPPIRLASAEITNNSPSSGYFVLSFRKPTDKAIFNSDSTNVKIVVYLKEPFEWKPQNEGRGLERLVWSSEDQKKYGHLTVMMVRVLGIKKAE